MQLLLKPRHHLVTVGAGIVQAIMYPTPLLIPYDQTLVQKN
jgi:hypothetical protein